MSRQGSPFTQCSRSPNYPKAAHFPCPTSHRENMVIMDRKPAKYGRRRWPMMEREALSLWPVTMTAWIFIRGAVTMEIRNCDSGGYSKPSPSLQWPSLSHRGAVMLWWNKCNERIIADNKFVKFDWNYHLLAPVLLLFQGESLPVGRICQRWGVCSVMSMVSSMVSVNQVHQG